MKTQETTRFFVEMKLKVMKKVNQIIWLSIGNGTIAPSHLEDHPSGCKWLGSPPIYKPRSSAIWKGKTPILRGRKQSPWLLTTFSIHFDDPPTTMLAPGTWKFYRDPFLPKDVTNEGKILESAWRKMMRREDDPFHSFRGPVKIFEVYLCWLMDFLQISSTKISPQWIFSFQGHWNIFGKHA